MKLNSLVTFYKIFLLLVAMGIGLILLDRLVTTAPLTKIKESGYNNPALINVFSNQNKCDNGYDVSYFTDLNKNIFTVGKACIKDKDVKITVISQTEIK